MTTAQLERLQEHLQRLHLFKSRDRLEALLQEATGKELSYAAFLDQVLIEEVASKTAKHVTMRTQLARFPFVKGLDAFDFSYQPSLDKKQIQSLSTCHFIERHENALIYGPQDAPGCRPRAQGDRAGVSRPVCHGRCAHHQPHPCSR
jgi:DNA replication protein DnaC